MKPMANASRDLVPAQAHNGELIEPGQETPAPPALLATANAFQAMSRAESTVRAYRRAWAGFEDWCHEHGRKSLPASPDTIRLWLSWMARHAAPDAPAGPVPARGTLDKALAAIVAVHGAAKQPFDRKNPLIVDTWKGIARAVAAKRPLRKAEPLMRNHLMTMLGGLRPAVNAEARDAALLALGWGGALRRSELVGLDWQRLGSGNDETRTGWAILKRDGIEITLATSKTSQTEAVVVVIPKADMKAAFDALQTWANVAALASGAPVFRAVTKGGTIGTERLTDRSVSRIIKARVRALARAGGETRAAAVDLAAAFSGHSLRRGYGTAAAEKNVPGHRIKTHMRHKSFETTAGYIQAGEAWSQSGLQGIFSDDESQAPSDAQSNGTDAPAAPDGSTQP